MQKFTLFSLVLFLFASCATTNDVVSDRRIQKRKYTKGYFVASNDKVKTETETEIETETKVGNTTVAEDRNVQSRSISAIATEKITPPAVLAYEAEEVVLPAPLANQPKHTEPSEALSANASSDARHTVVKRNHAQEGFDTSIALNGELASADDTEYLLMLILAILLPPLPIFIIFGLETEFWISLILTILLWLPGAIYAIIKVAQHYG